MYTVKECFSCSLGRSRINIVNGRGDEDAKILILGEAPGAEEDKTGLPFQGKSGKLLDKVLNKADVPVWITNCVRCRPPDNRNPTKEELTSCRGHLEREVEELNPSVIITLGRVPLNHLLPRGDRFTMKDLMEKAPLGCFSFHKCNTIPLYPVYHPSYILRNRSKEAEYIKDFVTLLQELADE